MRYFISTAVLLVFVHSAWAGAFLDRFNALERSIESIQSDVEQLKQGDTATKKSEPSKSNISNSDIDELKEAIKLLKDQQEKLGKMLRSSASKGKNTSDKGSSEADDDVQEQLDEISKTLSEIKMFTTGNHLKLDIDFRTSIDSVRYRMADDTKIRNDDIWSNRLWINMAYKATENISFKGQLAYNKFYGARSGRSTGMFTNFDNFDWVANETPADDTVRVRNAYYLYRNETFLGTQVPWTFSLGRRPSTNGHLANLREDDHQASPLGHAINVEFDGLSSKFDISQLTSATGMYIKFCMGRGMSNAMEKFSTTPYATNESDLKNINLAGAIVSLYDDKQYSFTTQFYKAWNLIDINSTTTPTGLETVGDMTSFTAHFMINGISTENAFLEDTIFFFSYSSSLSDPFKSGQGMLGSYERERGRSYWAGIQVPTFTKDGKFGIELNHGSKYWRSITYAEDTFIGSKLAARGEAYEAYWTQPFADGSMSWQLRYTYIDYSYTGSNGFFGSNSGTPMTIAEAISASKGGQTVESASDLRFYLRYRY